jgi:hypothetical protein
MMNKDSTTQGFVSMVVPGVTVWTLKLQGRGTDIFRTRSLLRRTAQDLLSRCRIVTIWHTKPAP